MPHGLATLGCILRMTICLAPTLTRPIATPMIWSTMKDSRSSTSKASTGKAVVNSKKKTDAAKKKTTPHTTKKDKKNVVIDVPVVNKKTGKFEMNASKMVTAIQLETARAAINKRTGKSTLVGKVACATSAPYY